MPIPAPTFDTRTYRELLSEALARVPAHNPEWTNLNESDPGVTLLQLFAFLSESIIYRANRIPERNRRKFLNLLGIGLRAAQPARGLVNFANRRGPLAVEVVRADAEVRAGRIPFRTQNGLAVLPIEARIYLKGRVPDHRRAEIDAIYRRLYASYATAAQTLDYYETKAVAFPDTGITLPTIDLADHDQSIDGSLWIALLARPREDPDLVRDVIGGRTLTLGLLPALDAPRCVVEAAGTLANGERPSLVFEFPDVERLPSSPPTSPATGPEFRSRTESRTYFAATARPSGDILRNPGRVEIDLPEPDRLGYWDGLDPLEAGAGDLPPSLEETDDQTRLVSWIRVRVRGAVTHQMTARFSWVGINAAEVIQRTHVAAQRLADGTGEPDQVVTLTNTPVLVESVQLTVGGEPWRQIDDLAAAAAEVPVTSEAFGTAGVTDVSCFDSGATAGRISSARHSATATDPLADAKVFTVDRESGEIRFGNGARGFRPPLGAVIQASYDFGGGRQGQVGIGTIKQAPSLSSNLSVLNPVPTWGGSDGESIDEAERRIPNVLRHRERIVSVADCREITFDSPGVELGRVEVLPLFHPDSPSIAARGTVTVLVIPRRDPLQPDAPRADRLFVETVCRHLEPRRVLTTELHVRGPVYVPVWVSVGIDVVPGFDTAPVREAVAAAIREFLSALRGGFDGSGWPLNKAVEAAEISAAATRVVGVAKVNRVLVAGEEEQTNQPIVMEGLQLPVIRAVSVAAGDPISLEEIRGQQPPEDVAADNRVPVPVVPEQCGGG